MAKGLLIVLSGPSGVGKGTILKQFINDPDLNLGLSISMTTRKMREGEKDGVNYYFVSKEEFLRTRDEGGLLEWAQFVGNYYGTPLKEVERLRNAGKNVLLEIEVEGCKQIKEKVPDVLTIFIVPPSMQELEKRINALMHILPEEYQAGFITSIKKINGYPYKQYLTKFYLEIQNGKICVSR